MVNIIFFRLLDGVEDNAISNDQDKKLLQIPKKNQSDDESNKNKSGSLNRSEPLGMYIYFISINAFVVTRIDMINL